MRGGTRATHPTHAGVIHRLVERRVVERGEVPAWVGHGRSLTYRELNARANAAARLLIVQGFRRGSHAQVALDRGADLAIALLAVLKSGGCYTYLERSAGRVVAGVRIRPQPGEADGTDCRYLPVDLSPALHGHVGSSSNLPVLMRPSDPAFLLEGAHAPILVPHASVTALALRLLPEGEASPSVTWDAESGPFEIWLALLNGATLRADGAVRLAA